MCDDLGQKEAHEDATLHRLGDVLWRTGMKMQWVYGLNHPCRHDIVVLSVKLADSETVLPLCVESGGACPPEPCGTPYVPPLK